MYLNQWSIRKLNQINILSALAELHYDLSKNKIKYFMKQVKDTEFVSEHVKFNSNFENKVLDTNWIAKHQRTLNFTLNIKKNCCFFKTIKSMC